MNSAVSIHYTPGYSLFFATCIVSRKPTETNKTFFLAVQKKRQNDQQDLGEEFPGRQLKYPVDNFRRMVDYTRKSTPGFLKNTSRIRVEYE